MRNDQQVWAELHEEKYGKPKRAFEVEDIGTRENFVLVQHDTAVLLYNTSRIRHHDTPTHMYLRDLIQDYREVGASLVPYNVPDDYFTADKYTGDERSTRFLTNPHECTKASEYYDNLYHSAISPSSLFGTSIMFLAHVDPITFEALEEEE